MSAPTRYPTLRALRRSYTELMENEFVAGTYYAVLLFLSFEYVVVGRLPVAVLCVATVFALVDFVVRETDKFAAILAAYDLPSKRDVLWIVGGVLATAITVATATTLLARAGYANPGANPAIHAGFANLGLALLVGVLAVAVAPPVEEYLFRHYLQRTLLGDYGRWLRVGIASAGFGAVHLFAYSVDLSLAVVPFVGIAALCGGIYGVSYERTDNLSVPTLQHACWNAVAFALIARHFLG